MPTYSFLSLFHIDATAKLIIALVSFIGLIVGLFASRYMDGDSQYTKFFYRLGLIIISVATVVAADHLLLFLCAWAASNYLLIQLMVHKPQWRAASNAGWLTAKTFIVGFSALALAFICLYISTGTTSIQVILNSTELNNPLILIATILMTVTAMTQSAIWPFHRWLLSSLNSPTPVSAIMHAGLVNGGGVLIVRFAPLFLSYSKILPTLFIIGMCTAVIGSLWKLIQSDIKRMLACSTMAQMGFMLAQCGLGLFPAAIAHLCWHGLFKANLFLSSNSAQREKRHTTNEVTAIQFIIALLCGIFGTYIFALSSHQEWLANNSSLILTGMIWIATSQLALNLIQNSPLKQIPAIIFIIGIFSTLYGLSIYVIEMVVSPLHLMQPQPLNPIYILGFILAFIAWAIMVLKKNIAQTAKFEGVTNWLYVKSLNASQPHASTITSYRHQYKF